MRIFPFYRLNFLRKLNYPTTHADGSQEITSSSRSDRRIATYVSKITYIYGRDEEMNI